MQHLFILCNVLSNRIITGRNEVVAKVIFLHLSVILFTGGACMAKGGGMHGKGGCMAKGGHAWQRGACMVKGVCGKGGMCGKGGHVW